MEQENKKIKKITLGFILSWILGIVAVISGVTYLFKAPGTGILFLFLVLYSIASSKQISKRKA